VAQPLPTGTVTLLFTDIEGSTRLLEHLGRDPYIRALDDHRRLLREAFTRFGGVEVEMQGDSFFFAFPNGADAVLAADQAQRALQAHGWESDPIRVRIGIHTGEPVVSDGLYAGVDVHRAARVMAAGHGGQVLVSETTEALVGRDLPPEVALRDLGEHLLKDLSRPLRLYQVGCEEHPPLKTLYRTNLPVQPTPFVGRRRELGEAEALLMRDSVRLLSLTGPGGSGKTRLGLQLAAELADRFRDGVYWLSLAAVPTPELVLPALARALEVRELPGQPLEATLGAALADREMLLLVDNFEHVLEARSLFADLLARSASLRVVVTTRRPLQLSAEHVYEVPPLDVPEAAELFLQRARQVDGSFAESELVATICRRLDRLPLAIELAAARVRILAPEALLERLERRLPVLTSGPVDAPERQRSLRATIAWSYELLTDEERRVFRTAGAFTGSFGIEAAEEICGTDLDTVDELVAKSLLRRWAGGGLGMLETIREFALDELESAGETAAVRDRHAQYYLSLAERLEDDLRAGPRRVSSLDRLSAELDNLRAALIHLEATGAGDRVLRLAVALWRFWMARGYFSSGRRWLERGMRNAAQTPVEPRAKALEGMAVFVALGGDFDRGIAIAEEGLSLYRRLGDQRGIGETLNNVGLMELNRGNRERGRALLEEAAAVALSAADEHTRGIAAANLAELALDEGDYEGATQLASAAADCWEAAGDPGYVLFFATLGNAFYAERRIDEAEAAFARCVGAIEMHWQRDYLCSTLLGLAAIAWERRAATRAAVLLGAADALLDAIGGSWDGFGEFVRTLRERTLDGTQQALDSEFARFYGDGRTLTLEEAIAEAEGSEHLTPTATRMT
jgi:predicted ATPase/class 3 adenylate cyclase